jgi:hypothetical protein
MRRRMKAGDGILNTTSRIAANQGSAMNVVREGRHFLGRDMARPANPARTALWTGGFVMALAHAGTAHAFRAIDAPPPTRAAVLNAPQADAASQADDRGSLRQGVVDAVSTKGDAVRVNGAWFVLIEGHTQVFRDGRPAPAGALVKGLQVKFTLAPGTTDQKTLGVVYVP